MIEIERTDVVGWESAIRGMRNPMNSWEKSDSKFNVTSSPTGMWLGANDLDLMKRLVKAGSDHSKFMRMLIVFCDITAPLYWWKEYDTYKVGTVANSCSTMHKIHEKEFTRADFSCDHLFDDSARRYESDDCFYLSTLDYVIGALNDARTMYCRTKDERYWWQMIQLLPASYKQMRTVEVNYAVLRNMYHARKNHKLDEWRTFCEWVETLPYAKELITCE